MSQGITVEAVRVALRAHELQALAASRNISHANQPGARAMRVDISGVQMALQAVADGQGGAERLADAAHAVSTLQPELTSDSIESDVEVATLVTASTDYQALTELLSRHFALMRLAIGGRG